MNTQDYRMAPSHQGPLANKWVDKPCELIYSLCSEVERLQTKLGDHEVLVKRFRGVLEFRHAIGSEIRRFFSEQHQKITMQLDAMAEVLGFKIDWMHDPRKLEEIIGDDVWLPDAKRIMLEKCEYLCELNKRQKEAWEALNG